jgi:AraC-like DNA-binding protein
VKHFSRVLCRPGKPFDGIPFSLRSVGHEVLAPAGHTLDRILDFAILQWTLDGRGIGRIGDKEYETKKGYVSVHLPGMSHYYFTVDEFWEYRWVTIDGPAVNLLLRSFNFPETPFYVGECPHDLFGQLEKAICRLGNAAEKQATIPAYELLIRASGYDHKLQFDSYAELGKNNVPDKMMKLVEQNFSDPMFGVNQLAELMQQNRSSLSRFFKDEIGMSPKEYITSLRIQKAMSILLETNKPIKDISNCCGFSSPNYFTKFFIAKTGLKPSEFRKVNALKSQTCY